MEAKILKYEEVPAKIAAIVGSRNGEIVDFFVGDLINESNANLIALSSRAADLMDKLVKFNYERVYRHERLESYKERVDDVLHVLFDRFLNLLKIHEDRIDWYMHDDNLPVIRVFGKYIGDRKILYFDEESKSMPNKDTLYNRIVVDFLSTLTDSFVFQACTNFFLPGYII
jgi:dGTP triphosphohydrolase